MEIGEIKHKFHNFFTILSYVQHFLFESQNDQAF